MARTLETLAEINAYVDNIVKAAKHHAQDVSEVVSTLATEVIGRLDLKTDTVSVYERDGNIARTCWVEFGGAPPRRWAFSYNYGDHKIELRRGSLRGEIVFSFDNSVSAAEINQAVKTL